MKAPLHHKGDSGQASSSGGELSLAAKLLACRLCRSARPHCEQCCEKCGDTCNGRQSCYYDLPEKELVNRAHILRDQEEHMKGVGMKGIGKLELTDVPVSEAERKDPALHMEMETLRGEREERLKAEAAQAEREKLIAQTHEAIGRIQAANAFKKLATVAELVWLRELKETKIYRDLPGVGTWENLCKYLGKDRRTTDEDLQNLATFGEDFLATSRQLSIGYQEMRQLRQLTYDGESFRMLDDGKTIVIEGETIVLGDDSAPYLEAALEKLLIKNKTLRDRNKRLEKDFKGAVEEEVASYESKEKVLTKEVERLKGFAPEEHDETWCEEQMTEIREKANVLCNAIAGFIVDPRLESDRAAQAAVLENLNKAELMLTDLRDHFVNAMNI